MTGSRIYDVISVASAAKTVLSRNIELQKASAAYFLGSQRTLISLINPVTKKVNIDLTRNSSYGFQRPSAPTPSSKNPSTPLDFDKRPTITPRNVDVAAKREYSTDNSDRKEKNVIGSAEKKNVS